MKLQSVLATFHWLDKKELVVGGSFMCAQCIHSFSPEFLNFCMLPSISRKCPRPKLNSGLRGME